MGSCLHFVLSVCTLERCTVELSQKYERKDFSGSYNLESGSMGYLEDTMIVKAVET